MNMTLFGSRNHFSVARFSSPCLRAWGPGVGSLSPPPCFLKQEGPGLSRASCKALSSWLDRAVCSCWVVLAMLLGEWHTQDCLLLSHFLLVPCWQVHPWGWESVWGLCTSPLLLGLVQHHPLKLSHICTGGMEGKAFFCVAFCKDFFYGIFFL